MFFESASARKCLSTNFALDFFDKNLSYIHVRFTARVAHKLASVRAALHASGQGSSSGDRVAASPTRVSIALAEINRRKNIYNYSEVRESILCHN